jgi:hypothetical protein
MVTIHVLGKIPIYLRKTSQFLSLFLRFVCVISACLFIFHLFCESHYSSPDVNVFCSSSYSVCVLLCPHPLPPHSSSSIRTFSLFLGIPTCFYQNKLPGVKIQSRRGNSGCFWLTNATNPSLLRVSIIKEVITTPTT